MHYTPHELFNVVNFEFEIYIKFNNNVSLKINEHLIKTKNKKLFKQSILVECNMNWNFTIKEKKTQSH